MPRYARVLGEPVAPPPLGDLTCLRSTPAFLSSRASPDLASWLMQAYRPIWLIIYDLTTQHRLHATPLPYTWYTTERYTGSTLSSSASGLRKDSILLGFDGRARIPQSAASRHDNEVVVHTARQLDGLGSRHNQANCHICGWSSCSTYLNHWYSMPLSHTRIAKGLAQRAAMLSALWRRQSAALVVSSRTIENYCKANIM